MRQRRYLRLNPSHLPMPALDHDFNTVREDKVPGDNPNAPRSIEFMTKRLSGIGVRNQMG